MITFELSEFNKLAKVNGKQVLSLYLAGDPEDSLPSDQDAPTRLKNQLKEVKSALLSKGQTSSEIDSFLQPVYGCLTSQTLFQDPSKGMAFFRYGRSFHYYELSLNVKDHLSLGRELYLLPMIPLLKDDIRFFILNLSLHQVSLLEATHYSWKSISTTLFQPPDSEEILGNKVLKRHLSTPDAYGSPQTTSYPWNTEQKEKIRKYLQLVDATLVTQILKKERAPLLIACPDELIPIYKEINTYPFLFQHTISGNHQLTSDAYLHQLAWDIIKGHFTQFAKERTIRYQNLRQKGMTSDQEAEIMTLAAEGRVDTLFIRKDAMMKGSFNRDSGKVFLDTEKTFFSSCLIDQTAKMTIRKNGKVFLLSPSELPDPQKKMLAILRF